MKLADYPCTLEALRQEYRQIEALTPTHRGFIDALNKVRVKAGLAPINLDELVIATLGRVEDKLNATQNEIRSEAGSESSNEQTNHQESQSTEATH